ncbi:MAG TPA: LCP family protein [Candidatus Lachnoclostridium stercorigallinarum]|uniref:LCP family protein n=1 Tax=Candidatus Lachnoclostridium stercorigallinarum TaxID=2838634 RepID=A0A9D2GH83_9FIRM|nr:LCP family protein [Candidatus Lachnoclostridium stercorigallinarum]
MSYEYEDELERMKNRKRTSRKRESDFINRHQEEFEERKIRRARALRKKRRKKKIIRLTVLLALVVVLFAGFTIFRRLNDDGYWTVAVFGVDSRDGNVEANALSDVIMLCNIERSTGEITLVSVYRDTYLKIDSDGTYHKINEAYFKGGHTQAVAALEENLDLQIDNYATFNWKAVAEAINILGGIDLEISDAEFAYINSFITETVNSTGIGSHQLEHSGMNHLDGVQAVAYARLRLMDTDFNRTARQRKVIGLALDKAKNASFSELNNILVTVLPQIATDLGIDDLLPLARNVSNYQIAETTGFPFSRETARIGRMDCVIPTTLESNVEQLHQLLFGDESYQAPASVRTISQKIGEDSGLTEVGENAPEANTGGGRVPATTPETVPPETETESAEETSGAEETTEEETIEPNDESTEEETSASETEEDETVGPGSQLPVPGEENKPSPGNKNPSESSGSASENRPGTDVPDERPSSLDSQNDRNEEAVSDGPSAPPAETSAGGSGSDESEEIGPGI